MQSPSWLAGLLLLLTSDVVAGDLRPLAREAMDRVTAAKDQRDGNALVSENQAIMATRSVFNDYEFALLLSNVALGLNRLSIADSTLRSNAYHHLRLAREALLSVGTDEALVYFPRLVWYPATYSSANDERSFAIARQEETELRLRLWRKAEDDYAASIAAGRPKQTGSSMDREPEARARYVAEVAAINYWAVLRREVPVFNRNTVALLASSYQLEPVDFDELRGLVEHHLNGSKVTNAWDSIVAQLPEKFKRQAAVAYAKPPVLTARASLLPPIVPPARGEPGLPAVARPSKLRDSFGVRGGSGAVAPEPSGKPVAVVESAGSGAEEAGGRPVWPWVGLGLAAFAGGWGWLRQRG